MAVGVVSCLGREIGRALKPDLLPPWANRPAEQGLEEVGTNVFLPRTDVEGSVCTTVFHPSRGQVMNVTHHDINYVSFYWPIYFSVREMGVSHRYTPGFCKFL